jgi:CBS-domain-containing membrane protein
MSNLVCDVMTREVVAASPATTFRELVRLIEDHHLHALPVVDERGLVVGMVTESDLLIREELTEGRLRTPLQRRGRARLTGTTAGEIMSSPVMTVNPSQTLAQAARLFRRRHIGRMPVVENDGRLIGIVTRMDLLTVFLRPDEELLAAVHEAIATVDEAPSCILSATAHDGVVVLQGSAHFLSQLIAVEGLVRQIPGIVHLDVKAIAVIDDIHGALTP